MLCCGAVSTCAHYCSIGYSILSYANHSINFVLKSVFALWVRKIKKKNKNRKLCKNMRSMMHRTSNRYAALNVYKIIWCYSMALYRHVFHDNIFRFRADAQINDIVCSKSYKWIERLNFEFTITEQVKYIGIDIRNWNCQ